MSTKGKQMYHRFEGLVRVSLLHARGDPWQETEQ